MTATETGFRQPEMVNVLDDHPMTPPPVNSPRLLVQTNQEQPKKDFPTDESNHWVVSYGYANREEFKELERILTSYGPISQNHANANWLAIKYESRLAAEKALCSQPIKLSSNSLCGTVRGSQQLLQSLQAQQPSKQRTLGNQSATAPLGKSSEMQIESASLSEEDILARYDGYDGMQRNNGSICEKVMAWLFDWDRMNKPHSD